MPSGLKGGMSMNFCFPSLLTKLCCTSVSADGYEIDNLISCENHIRGKGFQAERFTRVPIFLSVEFPAPIQLEKIILQPWIRQQCAKDIRIFSSHNQIQSKNDIKEYMGQFHINAGRAILSSMTTVKFINHDYIKHNLLKDSQNVDNTQVLTVNMNGKFKKVTGIKIGIYQMLKGSVPSIRSLAIWGSPSFSSSRILRTTMIDKWFSICSTTESVNPGSTTACSTSRDCSKTTVYLCKEEKDTKKYVTQPNAIPEEFTDPLMFSLMKNPVLLPSGYTIDQRTLDKHILTQAEWARPPSDPFTGVAFTESQKPVTNVQLKLKLDQYTMSTSQKPSIVKEPDVIVQQSNPAAQAIKRSALFGVKQESKKIKVDETAVNKSSGLTDMQDSLECSLRAARGRTRNFRPIHLEANNNVDDKSLVCGACNVFLTSLVVHYSLPCKHKLCRSCCVQAQNRDTAKRKTCPVCSTDYVNSQVTRTHI